MSGVLEDMDGIAPADIAERWYSRLMSPDCSMLEREQFEEWLRQSPENALAFEDTKALWVSLEGLEADAVLGPRAVAALQPDVDSFIGQWANATDGLSQRPPRPQPRRWLPLGAGIAATLAVGLFVRTALKQDIPAVPYATTNKIEAVKLSDGSSLQLDLATVIDVKLGDERRDIVFRQGRAMFQVAKDARRPFVVDAGVGTITALGTQFQVQREGDLVSVTLLEGSVGISSTGEGSGARMLRLAPGQKANYTPAMNSWAVEAADAAALTSWSQGFHVFGGTPLREAVAEINRYSKVRLELADASVGNLVVSGSFKLGDGKAVSEALPYALPVKTSEHAGTILISNR